MYDRRPSICIPTVGFTVATRSFRLPFGFASNIGCLTRGFGSQTNFQHLQYGICMVVRRSQGSFSFYTNICSTLHGGGQLLVTILSGVLVVSIGCVAMRWNSRAHHSLTYAHSSKSFLFSFRFPPNTSRIHSLRVIYLSPGGRRFRHGIATLCEDGDDVCVVYICARCGWGCWWATRVT